MFIQYLLMKKLNKMKIFQNIIFKTIALVMFGIALSNCSEDESTNLGPKPVADFTASATTVEKGNTITFADISTNSPSLWTWNFEGATPTYSNEANPTVLYEGAGTYSVFLKARNDVGADEILKEGYIVITATPVIDIPIDPQVRFDFEDNLDNAGLIGTSATTVGAEDYTTRPGGGKAFVFNGSNQLSIPGYTGINADGSRSVTGWIKTTHASTSGLVHWGAAGSFSRSSFKMQNTGVLRFEYQGGGHNGVTIVNDGNWHHIAYTYDGSTIKIYVDGAEDFTVSGKVLRTGEAGETDVDIGSQLGGSIYQGAMDDVRIFTEVLTPDEVLILSNIK